MHAWLQTIRMRLEAAELREVLRQSDERQKQLRSRLQEAKAEAAEAAAQKAKVQDLTGKLAIMQAQLASKNLQLQEVQRQIMEARREEDPKTAHLRGELRSLSQRNARLEATRKRLVAQLRESEEKREDACASAKGSGDHQDGLSGSSDPKKASLSDLANETADLENEIQKLQKARATAEKEAKLSMDRQEGLWRQVAESDQKLQKAIEDHEAEMERLQGLLSERQEAICQVQKDSKRVLNELEEWQRQCDKNDREIKELSRCCERSMQKEKEHKRAAAHLQKEVEKLSEKLLKVQEERQQVVREADRLRWGTFVLVAVSLCTILASVSLRRGQKLRSDGEGLQIHD